MRTLIAAFGVLVMLALSAHAEDMALDVSEGDVVAAGQVLARVLDAKIDFELAAIDARLQSLTAQLDNASAELARGEDLLMRGVTTVQRLDALSTQVDVVTALPSCLAPPIWLRGGT